MQAFNPDEQQENETPEGYDYNLKDDGKLTADEQLEVSEMRIALDEEVKRKKLTIAVIEPILVSSSSYAVGKWLVLLGGSSQVGFACLIIIVMQQISNRDLLLGFRANYNGGWQVDEAQKLMKVILSAIGTIFMLYLTVGNVVQDTLMTKQNYIAIVQQKEAFDNSSPSQQGEIIKSVVLALLVFTVLLGIFNNVSNRDLR